MKMDKGANRRDYGLGYERQAENYLLAQGYRLIARNVNFKQGEIDLIFEHDLKDFTELVFVEVRKRDRAGYIRAEESITFPKERRLRRAIKLYLLKYKGNAQSVSIDLIGFQDEELIHYPNFLP